MNSEPHAVDNHENATGAAARMLEVAGSTAEQLVSDAQAEAKSIVSAAQFEADAILSSSRSKASQVAADLARTQELQAAKLDRERVAALAELRETKATLETQVGRLRQVESRHRDELRRLLTEQLSTLDTEISSPPAGNDTHPAI